MDMSTPPKTMPKFALGNFLARVGNSQKGAATKSMVAELKEKIERKEREMLNCSSRVSSSKSDDFHESYRASKDYKHDPKSLQEVDLLLIGKTGNGKSALGNTILGHKAFESKSSLKSVTQEVSGSLVEWNGYKIKVVDSPGIQDNTMDTNQATLFILEAMSDAIALSPQGFHAFLLVVKFGGRFTAEDKLTVDTLKKIFGEKFFKKFCILVMTCGDKFKEEVDTSFQEWVQEQDHDIFKELLAECNNRIVLFNNKTQDVEKQKTQLNELLEVIESLKSQNCRYSDEHFNTALETRNVLLVESRKDLITDEIMDEANLIQQRLERILDSCQIHKGVFFLNELYQQAEALHAKTSESDKNTGVLTALHKHVISILNTIRDHLAISKNLELEAEKLKREREEQAIQHTEELRRQRQEYQNLYKDGKASEKMLLEMLQKQIDQMNEVNKRWDAKEKEVEDRAKGKWDQEKLIALKYAVEFQKLKEEQMKIRKAKISKNIFSKFKDKLFGKKI